MNKLVPSFFKEIESRLQERFQSNGIDVPSEIEAYDNGAINLTFFDNNREIEIYVQFSYLKNSDNPFAPETGNVWECDFDELMSGKVTYITGGIYFKERFNPGYAKYGELDQSLESLVPQIYDHLVYVWDKMIKNKEENMEELEDMDMEKVMRAIKDSDSENGLISLGDEKTFSEEVKDEVERSDENFEILVGRKNRTTCN